jgi:hypothetical protein
LAVLVAGPAAYALDTMATAYSGGDPSAGPTAVDASGGPAGFDLGEIGDDIPLDALPETTDGTTGGTTDGMTAPQGGMLGGGVEVDEELTEYLTANQGSATWVVAVTGADQAASIELATGLPVMAMGGFSGSDPAPTLEQFQSYVESGELRFVLISTGGGGGGLGGGSSDISSWVTANGTLVEEVGDGALYDLSALATAS